VCPSWAHPPVHTGSSELESVSESESGGIGFRSSESDSGSESRQEDGIVVVVADAEARRAQSVLAVPYARVPVVQGAFGAVHCGNWASRRGGTAQACAVVRAGPGASLGCPRAACAPWLRQGSWGVVAWALPPQRAPGTIMVISSLSLALALAPGPNFKSKGPSSSGPGSGRRPLSGGSWPLSGTRVARATCGTAVPGLQVPEIAGLRVRESRPANWKTNRKKLVTASGSHAHASLSVFRCAMTGIHEIKAPRTTQGCEVPRKCM
jgi:hypothetical protein